jgi:hypothetical protein
MDSATSNCGIFNLQHWRTYSRRGENESDDRLGVLDLTTRDHLERFSNRHADDFKNFVFFKSLFSLHEFGCEIDVHLILEKTRRYKKNG